MLLLHPLPTCADAGPDLCTLHLWCYLSIHQRKYSTLLHTWWSLAATCAGGIFPSAIGATLLVPVLLSAVATCAGGLYIYIYI